jgi:hypothetical protein
MGGGDVLFGQRLDDPLAAVLEGLLGDSEACQLHLELKEEEEVGGAKSGQKLG